MFRPHQVSAHALFQLCLGHGPQQAWGGVSPDRHPMAPAAVGSKGAVTDHCPAALNINSIPADLMGHMGFVFHVITEWK